MEQDQVINLDALWEPTRCAVLTERLPKELRERGCKIVGIVPASAPPQVGIKYISIHNGSEYMYWGRAAKAFQSIIDEQVKFL